MIAQLFSANIFFVNFVLSALVFFCLGWLHLDSWWSARGSRSMVIRAAGFFLVALALLIESPNFSDSTLLLIMRTVKLVGLGLVLASLLSEPLLKPPSHKQPNIIIPLGIISLVLIPPTALISLLIGASYLIKSSWGSEKQIKSAGIAFICFGLAEAAAVSTFWNNSPIVFLANLVAAFGPAWILNQSLLLLSMVILAKWGWGFLRFRTQPQVFLLTVTSSLLIFLVTTSLFTFLLYRNLEADRLGHLETDIKIFQYSLERMQLEALSVARWTAEHQALKQAIVSNNSSQLAELSSTLQLTDNTSFLNFLSAQGEVLMNSEDHERIGNNQQQDPVIQAALNGQSLSSISVADSALIPRLLIRAVAPIVGPTGNKVIGVVETGYVIDNAFVDGVQAVTGLHSSVFAGDKRTATTFVAPDGTSRYIGSTESNPQVTSQVLDQGQDFVAATQVLNQPFYAAYTPLQDYSQAVVGMLFVGQPQLELKATAEKTLQTTFAGSAVLMILTIIPAYFFSKYLMENLTA